MENALIKESRTREGLYCILFSLLIGVIFDRLLFDKAVGISYFIFIALCIAFFMWSIRDRLKFQKSFGWLLLIPIALLSLSFAVHTNGVLSVLNILMVPMLMVVSSILIEDPSLEWNKGSFIIEILRKGIGNVFNNLNKPFVIIAKSIKSSMKIQVEESKKQVLIGVLIALPLLAVIIMLLSSADMVFGYYLSNITEIFKNIRLENFIPHVVIVAIITFYLFAYIWGFKNKEQNKGQAVEMPVVSWAPITVITVLIALNIVYLMFTLIQFSYLYGGGNMTLPAQFTYAEYARRGFFELAAVTFINFIIVLSCMKFMQKDNKALLKASNMLLTILIVFTLNMMYSANFKLTLYENSYGYTFLRVAVHLFVLLLFILCMVVAAGIWNRKIPVIKAIIVITVAMYTIINYINIDAFIARKNIERYNATGKIDVNYLASLSYEALPYTLELRNSEDSYVRKTIEQVLKYKKQDLEAEKSWSEFNFSRSRARKLLSAEK